MGAPVGNDNAKKNKIWSEALRKHITQNPKDLAAAALALITKAKDGDIAAIKELGDRLEGKAVQQVVGAGDDGEHLLKSRLEYVIIDPKS